MTTAKAPDETRERLVRLGAGSLADCLMKLSIYNDDVDAAVQRLIATGSERIDRYKRQLASLRRSRKFIDWSRSRSFSAQLEDILENLTDLDCDPKTGVELVIRFFECDGNVLGRCDDSDGTIGNVFRLSARERWMQFATRCEDKIWIVDRLEKLCENDDYGVRDTLLEKSAEYLPEEQMRQLADRFWNRHRMEAADDRRSRHWALLMAAVANALVDPALYEKAIVAWCGGRVGGLSLDIARVYLKAGSATGALQWLESEDADSGYKSAERDDLLLEAYGLLGAGKRQTLVARRIFERECSVRSLDQLVRIVGEDQRQGLIEEAARRIAQGKLSYSGARFLLEVGRDDEADRHIVEHRSELNGDLYPTLLKLAKRFEERGLLLSTTCLYRALLDSILERGQSKYYAHGVRYLKKLDALAPGIRDWGSLESAGDHRARLYEMHGRKRSFWSKVGPPAH